MDKRIIRNSKLSNTQIRKVIDAFNKNTPAFEASLSLGINRHSVERVYKKIRIVVMVSEGENMPKDFLRYKHPLGFNGTIPIIGIKTGYRGTPWIRGRVIGSISNKEYELMLKNDKLYEKILYKDVNMTYSDYQTMVNNDEFNKKLYYNVYGINAVAIGNFECSKIISTDPTGAIGKFMHIYRKMLKKYYSINWKYTNQYLQEAVWRSKMYNFRNPQEAIVRLLEKYRDSSYLN